MGLQDSPTSGGANEPDRWKHAGLTGSSWPCTGSETAGEQLSQHQEQPWKGSIGIKEERSSGERCFGAASELIGRLDWIAEGPDTDVEAKKLGGLLVIWGSCSTHWVVLFPTQRLLHEPRHQHVKTRVYNVVHSHPNRPCRRQKVNVSTLEVNLGTGLPTKLPGACWFLTYCACNVGCCPLNGACYFSSFSCTAWGVQFMMLNAIIACKWMWKQKAVARTYIVQCK